MPSAPLRITIPDEVRFADLQLLRDPDGHVSFSWAAVEAVCAASGISPGIFREAEEDAVASLIVAWYAEHRARGGAADPVAEDLIAEAAAEDQLGGGVSYPPGRA